MDVARIASEPEMGDEPNQRVLVVVVHREMKDGPEMVLGARPIRLSIAPRPNVGALPSGPGEVAPLARSPVTNRLPGLWSSRRLGSTKVP